VSLLDDGLRVLPQFERMVAITRQLHQGAAATERALNVAAPSYMAFALLPYVVEAGLGFRIRTLELPPAQVRAHLSSGHFDLALSLGELSLQPSWETHAIGRVE
jgi:DNA-binding transcriptional LysR family regulator